MLFARQADDPVHIVQASFGADNLLLDARLENKSHNKIQTYRLGWVAVKKDEVRMGKGDLVTVPENVDTTAAFDIPGKRRSCAKKICPNIPQASSFILPNCNFKMEPKWQADAKKIKKEAIEMLK